MDNKAQRTLIVIKAVGGVNTQIFKLCVLIELFSLIPMVFAPSKNSEYFSSTIFGPINRLKTGEK